MEIGEGLDDVLVLDTLLPAGDTENDDKRGELPVELEVLAV